MWTDKNDKIADILDEFIERNVRVFPVKCPVCGFKAGHIYMHRWKTGGKKGGVWTWCSSCKSFFHGTFVIPAYWENAEKIEIEELTAIPDYLESMKSYIDEHAELHKVKE